MSLISSSYKRNDEDEDESKETLNIKIQSKKRVGTYVVKLNNPKVSKFIDKTLETDNIQNINKDEDKASILSFLPKARFKNEEDKKLLFDEQEFDKKPTNLAKIKLFPQTNSENNISNELEKEEDLKNNLIKINDNNDSETSLVGPIKPDYIKYRNQSVNESYKINNDILSEESINQFNYDIVDINAQEVFKQTPDAPFIPMSATPDFSGLTRLDRKKNQITYLAAMAPVIERQNAEKKAARKKNNYNTRF